ncbi:MAG: heparan-alpha-glucosaminide N-acetyltransferase domain-containing protein [Anaerolineales bacterium]|jgi:uncharacterized membrane protein
MNTHINWNYPQPRFGFNGAIDKFFGPGTTKAEAWIEAAFCVGAGIAMPIYAFANGFNWSLIQYILATWLAFDLVGGIITNATSSAKRWYHREGQGFQERYAFIALHVVYILLVAWLFRSMDWLYFGILAIYLLGAALIILKIPLYLQRPIAFGALAISLLVNYYVFSPTLGLEWFVPFLFFKLLVSHALREEPYRPLSEGRT